MSAGAFETGVYGSDALAGHNIKAQLESKALVIEGTANDYPAIAVTSVFWVKASQKKNSYGLRPRKLRIKWGSTPPGTYLPNQSLEVVIYDPALWATTTRGMTGTYLGAAIVVTGKVKESVFPE